MSSIIILVMTLIEVIAALAGYVLHSNIVFQNVVIYGSPFYLAMNLLANSTLILKNPLYIGFILFHLIKYYFFFRAQIVDDDNKPRILAIVLEIAYLAVSGYYLYSPIK